MTQDNSNVQSTHDKVTQKVIILYICENLDSLNRQELMQIALESMYMDYFQFTALLDELVEEKLISATLRKDDANTSTPRNSERYSLTSTGLSVLNTLRSNIPTAVSKTIHTLLRKNQQQISQSKNIAATYELLADGNYKLTLTLKENTVNPYFKLTLLVPNQSIAEQLKQNWLQNAPDIYPQILSYLNYSPADTPADTKANKDEKSNRSANS